MLKVDKISTGYGKKPVLFDVSFQVNKSEIVLLAGSNGSGKSTLLKAIYGLIKIWNNGQIYFSGDNITGKPTSSFLQQGLLYIPQKNNLFEDLTVKDNLEMAGLTIHKNQLKHRIEYALSIFTVLTQNLNRTPMKLSGGERQLLTLAMAMLHLPKMILIDEPLTGLSSQNITLVIDNLKTLNEKSGITLLIVEHLVRDSLRFVNRVIGLKLGSIFSQSAVNENFNIQELNQVFV